MMTKEQRKRALMIGRAKDLFEKGYSVSEIAQELKINESAVRECKDIIDKAEENRANQ